MPDKHLQRNKFPKDRRRLLRIQLRTLKFSRVRATAIRLESSTTILSSPTFKQQRQQHVGCNALVRPLSFFSAVQHLSTTRHSNCRLTNVLSTISVHLQKVRGNSEVKTNVRLGSYSFGNGGALIGRVVTQCRCADDSQVCVNAAHLLRPFLLDAFFFRFDIVLPGATMKKRLLCGSSSPYPSGSNPMKYSSNKGAKGSSY